MEEIEAVPWRMAMARMELEAAQWAEPTERPPAAPPPRRRPQSQGLGYATEGSRG